MKRRLFLRSLLAAASAAGAVVAAPPRLRRARARAARGISRRIVALHMDAVLRSARWAG